MHLLSENENNVMVGDHHNMSNCIKALGRLRTTSLVASAKLIQYEEYNSKTSLKFKISFSATDLTSWLFWFCDRWPWPSDPPVSTTYMLTLYVYSTMHDLYSAKDHTQGFIDQSQHSTELYPQPYSKTLNKSLLLVFYRWPRYYPKIIFCFFARHKILGKSTGLEITKTAVKSYVSYMEKTKSRLYQEYLPRVKEGDSIGRVLANMHKALGETPSTA